MTDPKDDQSQVALDLFEADPGLLASRAGQTLIADKGDRPAEFETHLAEHCVNEPYSDVVRPGR